LGTVHINVGHVQVINEQDHLLAGGLGTVRLQSLLVNVLLNNVLEIPGRGTGREVNVEEDVLVRVKLSESREDSDGLGGTGLTAEHDRALGLQKLV
jgi:hypothetical protein